MTDVQRCDWCHELAVFRVSAVLNGRPGVLYYCGHHYRLAKTRRDFAAAADQPTLFDDECSCSSLDYGTALDCPIHAAVDQ